MLVDSGAGLNLISPKFVSKLQRADEQLKVTCTFQGINPGRNRHKGKITLPVTFGGGLNYQTEKIVFDLVDLPLPYNGILGHQALAKFTGASHYAYNTLKLPGPIGVISIPSDKKDAIICVDKMYREAATAEAAEATAPAKVCINSTYLNKACQKDPFPMPRINQIVDSTSGCDLLSFLDAYSG
nr:uncharacterized protein LOC109736446 [Aegilops tauschii subsp. strangulata]